MTTLPHQVDLLAELAEIAPDSTLAQARATRQAATDAVQSSYLALFAPADAGDFPLAQRLRLAQRISEWHGEPRLAAHYAALLERQGDAPEDERLPAI